jgi:glucose-1-phosphate thymidylyltransferase
MNIIIPMAGWGSRLRPHTLTVPKPMLSIAGKSIVERLVKNIVDTTKESIDSISFIIRKDYGAAVEAQLHEIAKKYQTKSHICYQDEPLGTGHAILCAGDYLSGKIIVGFADTMFLANFSLDDQSDAIIWVKKIEDPSAFGVVKLNEQMKITDFVEKPKDFVSDLAIIGIYYFKDGANLRSELQFLIDHDIKDKGEFQLTTALENMRVKGAVMTPGEVTQWLDCGNKNATVESNTEILKNEHHQNINNVSQNIMMEHSVIIPPCYIAEGVEIVRSVIGPYVSIEKGTKIENSIVSESIIQSGSYISNKILDQSMIGSKVKLIGMPKDYSVGDFNEINF